MFRGNYQKGCFSVFYSIGSNPLQNWAIHHQNGYTKRVYDEDIKSIVLEIMGTNVSTTYLEMPKSPKVSMGIKMPFLVMLIKNMGKYFTFEVKILDDQSFCRRFRISNFQNKSSIKTFCTCMPMGMSPGWNQLYFNLSDFTRRAYGTNYMETVHIQVHANIRIRRIYFADRLYTEDELPSEFRLTPKPKELKRIKGFTVPAARPPSPAKSEKTKVTVDVKSEGAETAVDEAPTQPTEDVPIDAASSIYSAGVAEAGGDEAAVKAEDNKAPDEMFYY